MSSFSRPALNPYAAVSPTYSRAPSFAGSYGGSISGPSAGAGASSSSSSSSQGLRLPPIFKRLLKFTQMDFEVAVWEMTHLMVAPKKVFRNVYYRKQTKNTYSSTDPAFPYLLLFFLFLTSLAWSLAYADPSFANIVKIALTFTCIHCLLGSLAVATIMYFFVPRAFGPGGWLIGRPGMGRRRGLFNDIGGTGESELEFGFCFDVAIRAFFPVWVYLYVLQFLLLPAVTSHRFVSTLLSNTLYLVAGIHSTYVTFCGYNTLPSLSSTQLLLVPPLVGFVVLWLLATIVAGWNASLHLAPVLWGWGDLRKRPGGGAGSSIGAGAGGSGS